MCLFSEFDNFPILSSAKKGINKYTKIAKLFFFFR